MEDEDVFLLDRVVTLGALVRRLPLQRRQHGADLLVEVVDKAMFVEA